MMRNCFSGAEEELEQPGDQPAEPQREDVGEDLEAGHLLPQWPQLLLAHDYQVNHQFLPIFVKVTTNSQQTNKSGQTSFFAYLSRGTSPIPSVSQSRQSKIVVFVTFISKHRKNCECCHHHSLFKGHNVTVNIVVLNCQK